jgi:hypothetical protein
MLSHISEPFDNPSNAARNTDRAGALMVVTAGADDTL